VARIIVVRFCYDLLVVVGLFARIFLHMGFFYEFFTLFDHFCMLSPGFRFYKFASTYCSPLHLLIGLSVHQTPAYVVGFGPYKPLKDYFGLL
jgi:hypothetical protein